MLIVIGLVTIAALVAVALLAHNRLSGKKTRKALLNSEGYQEATIIIRGRYLPDTIRVYDGSPVRLHFFRSENNPCSERVIFSRFGVDRYLPAFQDTVIEFVPSGVGNYLFTCQWGMYRGKLVVMPAREKSRQQQSVTAMEKT